MIERRRESLNPGKKDLCPTVPCSEPDMTNALVAREDSFIKLCEKYDVEPTPRQASKYRRKVGLLYKKTKGLIR